METTQHRKEARERPKAKADTKWKDLFISLFLSIFLY
jgi:hypothetical protein